MTLEPESPLADLPPDNPFLTESEAVQLPPITSRARRRRLRRSMFPETNLERSAILENLANKAFPTFEFFLFSLLCGAVIGAAYLLDSQALLLLGVLLAPLLAPWVGLCLATVTGAGRFFIQTLAAFILSTLLVFGSSLLAGFAGRAFTPLTQTQVLLHTHLWWPNLFVLALGAVLLIVSFVRSEQKPILPGLMLAYGIFPPLSAAAYGLGLGHVELWQNGLLVFGMHLALAFLMGILSLSLIGFRPRRLPGCLMTLLIAFLTLLVIVWVSGGLDLLMGFFNLSPTFNPAQSTATPTMTSTLLFTAPATSLDVLPKPSQTPSLVIPPSQTPEPSITPQATPVYARITSENGLGANVRAAPDSSIILVSLVNGTLVEILPDVQVVNGISWLHIRTSDGIIGWILQSLVVTATPAPGW